MIYTVTMNPAIDYVMMVPDYQEGLVNRSKTEKLMPGGKGINVSLVLKALGFDSVALGFKAGFTGDAIEKAVQALGVKTDFLSVDGLSRINVKIKSDSETEINACGPIMQPSDMAALIYKLKQLADGDVLVLSGSVPRGVPDTVYGEIMAHLSDKCLKIVVDATGNLLRKALAYHPFLIKPNVHELGELFSKTLRSDDEIARCAKALQEQGATNILVSKGGNGAVFVSESGTVMKCKAPKGTLVNSTGAGDSMVAGFLAEFLQTDDFEKAFYMGLAAGSASAFSENLATKEEILKIYHKQLG